jgi:hypothetical protein
MGTKRAFRSSIGFTVHDVPSTKRGSVGSCCRRSGCACLPGFDVFGLGFSVDGSVRVVRFRLSLVPLRSDHRWRQRRRRSSANRTLSRVFAFLESVTARVSGDHREVIVGRQLFARGRGWRRWPSGRSSWSWSRVESELASDSERGPRGGGNTFGQLDRVSCERAPER